MHEVAKKRNNVKRQFFSNMGGAVHCKMRKSESDNFGSCFGDVYILNNVILCFYLVKLRGTFYVKLWSQHMLIKDRGDITLCENNDKGNIYDRYYISS